MRKRTLAVAACGLTTSLLLAQESRAQGRDDVPAVPVGSAVARHDLPIGLAVLTPEVAGRRPGPVTVRAVNRGTRVIVACGVIVLRRDRHARLRHDATYVIRPRYGLAAGAVETLAFPLDDVPPAFDLRPTFTLFADGSWAGDATAARAEIEGRREEYRVARRIAMALATVPAQPARRALVRLADRFSEGLARAVTPEGRAQYDAVLRTLASALDERTRAGRPYSEAIAVARRRVERVLDDGARLAFVVPRTIRE